MKINPAITYPPLFTKSLFGSIGNAANFALSQNGDSFSRLNSQDNNVSFQGACSTSNFKVKRIKNIRCPACGKITMTHEQIDKYVRNIAPKKGQELVDALDELGDESYWTKKPNPEGKTIYRPQKQIVVNIIKEIAPKNPNLDLAGIVKIGAKMTLAELIDKQMVIFLELDKYLNDNSKRISTKEKQALLEVFEEYKKRAIGFGKKDFKNKDFKYDISELKGVRGKIKQEVLEIVEKLPTSNNDANSFFVKYSKGRSSEEIATKLVYQNIPTAEHMICASKKGKNATENFICDCADCNSKRSDTPFYIWAKSIPNFQENLQDYLREVNLAVCEGRLGVNYDSYVDDIITLVEKLSSGKIKLEKPKLDSGLNVVAAKKRKNMEHQRISKILNRTIAKRRSLNNDVQILKAQMQDEEDEARRVSWGLEINSINKQIDLINRKIDLLSSQKFNLEKDLEELETGCL